MGKSIAAEKCMAALKRAEPLSGADKENCAVALRQQEAQEAKKAAAAPKAPKKRDTYTPPKTEAKKPGEEIKELSKELRVKVYELFEFEYVQPNFNLELLKRNLPSLEDFLKKPSPLEKFLKKRPPLNLEDLLKTPSPLERSFRSYFQLA